MIATDAIELVQSIFDDRIHITPLIGAINTKNTSAIVYLLENSPESVNVPDSIRNSPLFYALNTKNVNIIRLLLDYGANPDKGNIFGDPLNFAINLNLPLEVISTLLAYGAYTNNEDNIVGQPICSAIMAGNKAVVSLLLDHDVKPDTKLAFMKNRVTPLLLCLVRYYKMKKFKEELKDRDFGRDGLRDMIILLLNKGADINAQDEAAGTTAIMHAAHFGFTDIVKILIDYGADLTITDSSNRTVLDYAQAAKQQQIVDILKTKQI